MSEVTEKIRSRGHWEVAIRPEDFAEERVDYAQLDEILEGAVVRFRGWPVPYVDHRASPRRGDDWIGQDVDAEVVSHYEAWRFFTSGQFNHLRAVSADWRSGSEATSVPERFTSVIEVWEIVYYLTEIFEFATRLALSPAGGEAMTIDVHLNGLDGRGLVVGQPRRIPFDEPYAAPLNDLARVVTLARDQLVAGARDQAVKMARDMLLRFGWKPSFEQVADFQRELVENA